MLCVYLSLSLYIYIYIIHTYRLAGSGGLASPGSGGACNSVRRLLAQASVPPPPLSHTCCLSHLPLYLSTSLPLSITPSLPLSLSLSLSLSPSLSLALSPLKSMAQAQLPSRLAPSPTLSSPFRRSPALASPEPTARARGRATVRRGREKRSSRHGQSKAELCPVSAQSAQRRGRHRHPTVLSPEGV